MRFIRDNIDIIILYILLVFGGIWQITGLFSDLTHYGASPIMIWIAVYVANCFYKESTNKRRDLVLFVGIVILTWLVEALGTASGVIFGEYHYGNVLQPKIADAPLIIGFSWLGTMLSAFAFFHFIERKVKFEFNSYWVAIFVSLLAVLLDFFLEPAAIKMNYWTWTNNNPPLQNYIAWFVISLIISIVLIKSGFKYRIENIKFAFNAYIAQILFFFIVWFK